MMITPTDSVAADKMKLDAESLLRMQEPQGTFMYGGPVKGAPFTAQQISNLLERFATVLTFPAAPLSRSRATPKGARAARLTTPSRLWIPSQV